METIIQVDVMAITFLVGTVIPLVTALVTKAQASSRVKAAVNVVLSLASGATAYIVANDYKVTAYGLISAAVAAFLASGTTYQNLWKPSGAAANVANIAPRYGLGTEIPLEEQPAEPITALVSNTLPVATEGAQVTTLKGKAVYADASGYLFVPSTPDASS